MDKRLKQKQIKYENQFLKEQRKHSKEYWPDCTVSNTKFSFMTLNELAKRKDTVILSFNKTAYEKTDINPNGVQIMKTSLEYMVLNNKKNLISQNIFADLKGPKEKYKLHYGRCTGLIFRAAD